MDHNSGQSGGWLVNGLPSPGWVARAHPQTREDVAAIEARRPEDLLPGRTIYECLCASVAADPTKPALMHMTAADPAVSPRTMAYSEVLRRVRQSANFFRAVSGGPASVAILLPNLPQALIAAWGGATAGTACPINPFLEVKQIASILNSIAASVLVTASARHGVGAWNKLGEIGALVPSLREIVIVDADTGERNFVTCIARYQADGLDFEPTVEPLGDAMLMPTGGTTAAPKLVRLSHRGLLLCAWNAGAMSDANADGVIGHAMPNFHVGGAVALSLRAILFGQTLLTLTAEGFRNREIIARFWDIVRRFRMTAVIATPATAAAILSNQGSTAEGHSLRSFICGGSTVPIELARSFHDRFGIWIREVWGMTEVHGMVTSHLDRTRPPVVGSVGQALPFQKVTVAEVDSENRYLRSCTPGTRGNILIGGAGVMAGYRDARLNQDFFVKDMPGGEIWGNTGDLGTVDADGYAWIYGRSKDMIIRGGHNIDPRTIEEALSLHPAVQIAAAVGRPVAAKGELPIAYVQLKPGAHASTDELLGLCREHMQERAAVPVEVIILPQMPMTAVGKIAKPALRIDAMRRVAREVATSVLGNSVAISVDVDETRLRPRVVLKVAIDPDARASIERMLRDAFRTYEFTVELRS